PHRAGSERGEARSAPSPPRPMSSRSRAAEARNRRRTLTRIRTQPGSPPRSPHASAGPARGPAAGSCRRPVAEVCLPERKERHGSGLGPEDARAERDGRHEGERPKPPALGGGEAALRADENGGGSGLECRERVARRSDTGGGFVGPEEPPARVPACKNLVQRRDRKSVA